MNLTKVLFSRQSKHKHCPIHARSKLKTIIITSWKISYLLIWAF